MPYSRREQAFEQVAAAVYNAHDARWDESMQDVAETLVRSADQHTITGPRGEQFEWCFDYDDVPEIAERAMKFGADVDAIYTSMTVGPDAYRP